MITIPEIVEDLVQSSPFLEETLSQGLINNSALARNLKPEIEKRLLKDVQLGAIVMALNRLSKQMSFSNSKLDNLLNKLGDISIRSNIVSYTFENSSTLTQNQAKLIQKSANTPHSFLTITDGVFETAFFASKNLSEEIEKLFAEERLKIKISDLSSITIVIPEEALHISGVYYSILKKLAWEGINFVEVVSSYTELTIFIEDEKIDKAFSALKKIN